MEEYLPVRLPSFEADVERDQPDLKKLDKFISDLSKAPRTLKNAHSLRAVLKPIWSCHFNTAKGNKIVIYFVCDGPGKCFKEKAVKNTFYLKFQKDLFHTCDGVKKIFLCHMKDHKIYNIQ
jgi:mRNA-degrading endonuclease YafQ of YafQ-DinJ toxin-antitoxin module